MTPKEIAVIPTPSRAYRVLIARSGHILAATCADHTLRILSLPEGKVERTIALTPHDLDDASISRDGSLVAAADHTGDYSVWNTATGARQLHLQLPYYAFATAFSPDAKRFAIAPANQPVQVYDPATGKKLYELSAIVGGTAALAFSPDSSRLSTADADTLVRVYDARNGELISRHTDFLLVPLATTFTADGRHVLAGGGDKYLAQIDAAKGTLVRKSEKLVDPVAYLEVSPDGATTAVALLHAANMDLPAPVLIIETATGRKLDEWKPPTRAAGGAWTQDGRLLVAVTDEKAIHLWQIR